MHALLVTFHSCFIFCTFGESFLLLFIQPVEKNKSAHIVKKTNIFFEWNKFITFSIFFLQKAIPSEAVNGMLSKCLYHKSVEPQLGKFIWDFFFASKLWKRIQKKRKRKKRRRQLKFLLKNAKKLEKHTLQTSRLLFLNTLFLKGL